jgi:hypothetical protein
MVWNVQFTWYLSAPVCFALRFPRPFPSITFYSTKNFYSPIRAFYVWPKWKMWKNFKAWSPLEVGALTGTLNTMVGPPVNHDFQIYLGVGTYISNTFVCSYYSSIQLTRCSLGFRRLSPLIKEPCILYWLVNGSLSAVSRLFGSREGEGCACQGLSAIPRRH